MDVNFFQILLINVTFYLQYVWKLIWNVLIKNVEKEYNRHWRSKGYLQPKLRVIMFLYEDKFK